MPKRFLKFSDRWMFNRVLCEKKVCRKILRAALGIEVGEITYLNAEQAKEPAAASRGVRMDVFAREGSRVFDIEMQVSPEDRIGRRMRYYQAAIDATELDRGEGYELLPESFIVFFCTTDPFNAGHAVYSIERTCLEAPGLAAGDDSHWRVFNASAAEDVADPGLRDLLHYVATGRPEGALSREIDSFVEEYNRDREWVTKVLTYEQDTEMRCRRAEARGIEQGIEQGMDRFGELMGVLLDAGRLDDAKRASEDAAYRDALLAEFRLG